jgi:hypothetical protein
MQRRRGQGVTNSLGPGLFKSFKPFIDSSKTLAQSSIEGFHRYLPNRSDCEQVYPVGLSPTVD